jgi:hypothetical protein
MTSICENETPLMKFHMIAGGPKPVAPFSHAVETDGFVLVTGQMPDTPGAPGVLPEVSWPRPMRSWPTCGPCWPASGSP